NWDPGTRGTREGESTLSTSSAGWRKRRMNMRVMYERCCGLDIHKATIAACALVSEQGKTQEETRRFGTMKADLMVLADWLQQKRIQHVAMESTGVYWKPGLEYFGAGGIGTAVGQRARSQNRAGPKNGPKGLPMDRRFAQARIAATQFRSSASD